MPCPGGNRVALHDTADRFRQAPVGEIRGELLLLCTRLSPAASKPLAVVSLVWGLPATPPAPPRYALIYAKRRKKIKYVNIFFFFFPWQSQCGILKLSSLPPSQVGTAAAPAAAFRSLSPSCKPPPPPQHPPYLALGVQASSKEVPRGAGLLQQTLEQPQAQSSIAAGQQDAAHAEPLHPHRSWLCCPSEVWQSVIWEVAARVLPGWMGGGGDTACTSSPGGDGAGGCSSASQGVTHHLDHGDVSPPLYPTASTLPSHGHPKGVTGPSHLSRIIVVTPGYRTSIGPQARLLITVQPLLILESSQCIRYL